MSLADYSLSLVQLWLLLVVALLGRKDKGSLQYQDYLPSYPLPTLKQTCSKSDSLNPHAHTRRKRSNENCCFLVYRYLKSVKPLLKEEEYLETEKVCCRVCA